VKRDGAALPSYDNEDPGLFWKALLVNPSSVGVRETLCGLSAHRLAGSAQVATPPPASLSLLRDLSASVEDPTGRRRKGPGGV